MDYPMIPSYLVRIAPDYYAHRGTGRYGQLSPQQVHHLSMQENFQVQQRYAHQRAGGGGGYIAAPWQAQAPLVINNHHGSINFGPANGVSHQFANGGQLYNYHNPGVYRNFGIPNNWNVPDPASIPASVPTFDLSPIPPPAPAQAPLQRRPAEVIDLTEDVSVQAPIVASSKAAVTPEEKANPSFWKKGKAHLERMLNNQSGSNAWRLFESMLALDSSKQKLRYCEARWPTEEAAYEDISEMSRYFIDAGEMLMYASKWNCLEKLSTLEDPSDEVRKERQQLEQQIADEKSALQKSLPAKNMVKRDREMVAQYSNMVKNMTRTKFQASFHMKKSDENVRKVVAAEEVKVEEDRAWWAAGLRKRKATTAPAAARQPGKKIKDESDQPITPEVAPALQQALEDPLVDSDIDAEGETDDELVSAAPSWTEADLLQDFLDESPANTRASTPAPLEEDSDNIHSPPEDTGSLQEQGEVPAPQDEDIDVFVNKGFSSIHNPTPSSLEQDIAPGWSSPPASPREENTVVAKEVLMEKVTDSSASPAYDVSQEGNTVADEDMSEADIDNLFECDDVLDDIQDTTPEEVDVTDTKEVQVVNDLPAIEPEDISTSEETPTPPIEALQVPEDLPTSTPKDVATHEPVVPHNLPPPMSEEEAAALMAKKAALTTAHNHLSDLLAKNRARIAELESLIRAVASTNPLMRARMVKCRPANEAELRERQREVEQQAGELVEVEWETAVLPSVQTADKQLTRTAACCGGSKGGY